MVVIQSLPHHHGALPSGRRIVELPMTAHDRRRVRRRIDAPDGETFALELPTGTILHAGQILHVMDDRAYVVAAAPEEVMLVRPRDSAEAARIGHLIGNLHRDIDIQPDGIVALWDEVLAERVRRVGATVERTSRPFRGNAAGEHSH
jgi:urease accessory protein